MIRSTLANKFTKINFFFHNLAQLKGGSATDHERLLSFMWVPTLHCSRFGCRRRIENAGAQLCGPAKGGARMGSWPTLPLLQT